MNESLKPRLAFFRYPLKAAPRFIELHDELFVRTLEKFFEVSVITEDCDFSQICDQIQPDLVVFESGKSLPHKRIRVSNCQTNRSIPRLGFIRSDPWCSCRTVFLRDMERLDVDGFFSFCVKMPTYLPPELSKKTFVLPHCLDTDLYLDYKLEKTIPVLVTGSQSSAYPWRKRVLSIIAKEYSHMIVPHFGYDRTERTEHRMLYGERYARALNASWFVPTCGTFARAVVLKHLEIPACKACLIAEDSDALRAYGFEDMKNCLIADESNLADKMDHLMSNQEELLRIIEAGHALVYTRHVPERRDEVLQWLSLARVLKPGEEIVQTAPFEPLRIVRKTEEIIYSLSTDPGLDRVLLKEGDAALSRGEYLLARGFYEKCFDYCHYIPEPKLKSAICSLYLGDTASAYTRLWERFDASVKYSSVPDPAEWAYFFITLLCQGNLLDAENLCRGFQRVNHTALGRTLLLVQYLKQPSNLEDLSCADSNVWSLHELPSTNAIAWFEEVKKMLIACGQTDFAKAADSLKSKLALKSGAESPSQSSSEAFLPVDFATAEFNLKRSRARNCIKRERFLDGAILYKQLLESSDGDPDILFQLGFCLYKLNEKSSAKELFEMVLQDNPADKRAKEMLEQIEG